MAGPKGQGKLVWEGDEVGFIGNFRLGQCSFNAAC